MPEDIPTLDHPIMTMFQVRTGRLRVRPIRHQRDIDDIWEEWTSAHIGLVADDGEVLDPEPLLEDLYALCAALKDRLP